MPLAGCGHAAPASSAVASARPGTSLVVQVQLGLHGCAVSPGRIADGPVTFTATNTGDTASSEFGVERAGVVLAENEEVGPGLTGSIELDVTAGTYQVVCPDADPDPDLVGVSVVHVAEPPLSAAQQREAAALRAAVTGYRRYLAQQTASLRAGTTRFEQAILAGDVAAAKAAYGPARVPYERIEPVAEGFPDLDALIDERVNDVPAGTTWTGFHRLEQALWVRGSVAGTSYLAKTLLFDVDELQARVTTIPLEPAQLADGAVSLLDEVGQTKITGEEERYSQLDLLDIQANVDGARETLELLAPALTDSGNGVLVSQARAGFATVDAALSRFRTGSGPTDFVAYPAVPAAGRRAIAQDIDALGVTLSQVPRLVC